MERTVEGTHTGFLIPVRGKWERQKADRTWVTTNVEVVREAEGTHPEMAHIGRRQGTVAQWVMLRPIFEVCERETGYEGGGRRREAWWTQEEEETHSRETLE